MRAHEPSPAVAAWAADRLGGACRFHGRGSRVEGSRVWTACSASGRQAFLKEPSSRRKWAQEREALARWAPQLPGVLPRLLDALDAPPALLIEALPGLGGERAMRSREIEQAAHRAAGAALGRLHALPIADDDPLPLSEALPRRLDSWLERSGDLLTASARQDLRERVGDGAAFRGERRVPCHRDVEPRNWLIELDESRLLALRLVDFEHARLDHRLTDLVKLDCGAWSGRPDLRAEFLDGQGGALDAADEDRLRRLVLLHLLATLVRAHEHDDARGAETARRLLTERIAR